MLTALSSALLLTALAGAVEPDPTKKPQPPAVKFQGVTASGQMLLEVTNPNAEPVPYVGYLPNAFAPPLKDGRISPLYRIELRRGGAWKPADLGWCGTGVGPVSIPARGRATFEIHPPQREWDEVRIGLTWFPGADRKGPPAVAWSNPISRKDAPLKKAP
jgi:hypothetical protein